MLRGPGQPVGALATALSTPYHIVSARCGSSLQGRCSDSKYGRRHVQYKYGSSRHGLPLWRWMSCSVMDHLPRRLWAPSARVMQHLHPTADLYAIPGNVARLPATCSLPSWGRLPPSAVGRLVSPMSGPVCCCLAVVLHCGSRKRVQLLWQKESPPPQSPCRSPPNARRRTTVLPEQE